MSNVTEEQERLAKMVDAKAVRVEYCLTLTPWCDPDSPAHHSVGDGYHMLAQRAADWRTIARLLRQPEATQPPREQVKAAFVEGWRACERDFSAGGILVPYVERQANATRDYLVALATPI